MKLSPMTAIALALAFGSAHADLPDPWNTLYDGWDGVTCDYFNVGARIKWRNRQGDWFDAEGKPRGDAPFAEAYVQATGRLQTIEWNVTALVEAWLGGKFPNAGFLLAPVKSKPMTDTASFASVGKHSGLISESPRIAARWMVFLSSRMVPGQW